MMEVYRRMMSRLPPLLKMIVRTIVYSVALGLPLIFAFICLAVTVADAWRYVESPIVVLVACAFGLAFVVIAAALVGGVMAFLTGLLYSRIQDPARYRLLLALVPLAVFTYIIGTILSDDPFRFRPTIRYPFQLRLFDIAGWLLAASVAVGISQIVAHKYDGEMSARKRKAPVAMWRAIPLTKMALRITLFSAVLSVAVLLLSQAVKPDWWVSGISQSTNIVNAAWSGLSRGLMLGNVLAVATMLGFSEISRQRFYRFAMATLALIIAITFRSKISILSVPVVYEPRQDLFMVGLTLAHDAVLVGFVAFAASLYCREVAKPLRNSHDLLNAVHNA